MGDRYFSLEDIARIQSIAQQMPRASRARLSRVVCDVLGWYRPNGAPRTVACELLLQHMQAAGMVHIRPAAIRGAHPQAAEKCGDPLPNLAITASLAEMQPIRVVPVASGEEQWVWNGTMAAYHPLGYQRAFGARQHYWIVSEATSPPSRLGGLLFASSAKALAVRDEWIGWTAEERGRFRPRIINNSRYLILPGVHVPHLASHVLALTARRIRRDWQARYGFAPVLLETFIEDAYPGTSYAAANWIRLGETVGRTRQDRYRTIQVPKKSVWMYPLVSHWRNALQQPWPEQPLPSSEIFIQPDFWDGAP